MSRLWQGVRDCSVRSGRCVVLSPCAQLRWPSDTKPQAADVSRESLAEALNLAPCPLPLPPSPPRRGQCDLLTDPQEAFKMGAKMEKTCRQKGFEAWYITSAKASAAHACAHTASTRLHRLALRELSVPRR
jgi:hypothetical protein